MHWGLHKNEDMMLMMIVTKRMTMMMVVVSKSPGMRLGGQDQASHATGSQSGCFFLQIKVFKFFRGVYTSQFSNAFESSWHCLSSSPTCSWSNLLGNHRLHPFQNINPKSGCSAREKICKAQNFYFMLLSTSNLSSQPPPNNQSWLKIYWKKLLL